MKNQEPRNEPFPDPAHLVVEAFLDGETLERSALLEALSDPDAREHFVDLLVLRHGIAALEPSAWSAGSAARPQPRRRWWAAAAVVILSVATGFLAGQRTVDAVDATTNAAAVEAVAAPSNSVVAPRPTRVVALQPGVNWTESTGDR